MGTELQVWVTLCVRPATGSVCLDSGVVKPLRKRTHSSITLAPCAWSNYVLTQLALRVNGEVSKGLWEMFVICCKP